jgi:hypothetical protein
MSNLKHVLTAGFLTLALAGCGGSGNSSSNTDNTGIQTVEKSFTVSLANVEVARTSDGMPVSLEASDIQSGGTVTISQ